MLNVLEKKPNKYLLLMYTISIASFMVNLDTYIVNVALPSVAADFNTGTSDVSWIALSYNLMVVSLLLIFGKLGDKFGVKRMFIGGFIIFTVGSLLCGLSTTLSMIILSRFMQGVGASILYALPQAMITKYIPKEKRGMAFGILASAAALGITLGAPVSGLITGVLNWRWIFFINLPVGLFAIYHLCIALPKDFADFSSKKPFDIWGAVLSFLSALFLTFYINRLNQFSCCSRVMVVILILALVCSVLFFIRIKKYKFPLLDINLFKNPPFDCANIAMFLVSAFLAGTNFLMPFYLSEIKHLSVIQTGFVFMIYSISYMITSIISGCVSNKITPQILCTVSMLTAVVNILFFVFMSNTEGIIYVTMFLVFCGISFSFFITSNNNLVMSMASKGNVGMIAGTHRMIGRLGMLFGVAGFEAILSVFSANLILAFNAAYLTGALICFIAMIFSVPVKTEKY